MRVTGKRGRNPLTYHELSVLLQLIILAPAEDVEREGSLLGAIHPLLRQLAGKGVRNLYWFGTAWF